MNKRPDDDKLNELIQEQKKTRKRIEWMFAILLFLYFLFQSFGNR